MATTCLDFGVSLFWSMSDARPGLLCARRLRRGVNDDDAKECKAHQSDAHGRWPKEPRDERKCSDPCNPFSDVGSPDSHNQHYVASRLIPRLFPENDLGISH
jgi:hypothetical protein